MFLNETIHPGQVFERTNYEAVGDVMDAQQPMPFLDIQLERGSEGKGPFLWMNKEPFFVCSEPSCRSRYSVAENPAMVDGEQCKRKFEWTPEKGPRGKYQNTDPITLTCKGVLGRPGRMADEISHAEIYLGLRWQIRDPEGLSEREKMRAEAYYEKWFTIEGADRRKARLDGQS